MTDRASAFIAMRLAVTLLLLTVCSLAAVDKFMEGSAPQWFIDQFGDTWMGTFPQTPMFLSIAIFEAIIAILALTSLLMLEWLRGPIAFLRWTLVFALFLFVGLGFGARVSAQFQDAASHYFYFAGTLVMFFVVEWADPERELNKEGG